MRSGSSPHPLHENYEKSCRKGCYTCNATIAEVKIDYIYCNLPRKDFGCCKVRYSVRCFVQLVSKLARNIAQCNSSSKYHKLQKERWLSYSQAVLDMVHVTLFVQSPVTS